ncbi:MerR family transcriptional regulator [Nonomuraea typhae]|uniref:helix-turn-helix domain-containing protein n=1 Tax=Nonomuraea typhae TaxID=2603600 RepID=UPI0012F96238|nr:helix-turn-helix domain-containing protein [Nonomuraea typhae]
MSETWTIGELAEQAADALRPGPQRANGRIQEVPGERLIRWYTTIGLVDPPLTRRGRIAQYGRRHLLQVVAIKRLQAEGHSIAEIQARLAGATDAILEAAALLGADGEKSTPSGDKRTPSGEKGTPSGEKGTPDGPDGEEGTAQTPRPRFWATRPAASPARETPPDEPAFAIRLPAVRLAPGVALVLDGAGRTPTDDDIEAVLAAAGPLLHVLKERKLT